MFLRFRGNTLSQTILTYAKRDVWQDVGRVRVKFLKETFKVSTENIIQALRLIDYEFRIYPDIDGMILIYFNKNNIHTNIS